MSCPDKPPAGPGGPPIQPGRQRLPPPSGWGGESATVPRASRLPWHRAALSSVALGLTTFTGTSIALADRLDHTGTNTLRYAPSAPLESLRTGADSVISTS